MVNQIGAGRIRRLMEQWGSAKAVWNLEKEELIKTAGMKEEAAGRMLLAKQERDWERDCETLTKMSLRLVTIEENEYPKRLLALPDAPYGLFVRGRLPDDHAKAVAIVGARQCSEYGRTVAGRLGEVLAARGVDVISGMAKGIDSAGHFGALRGGGNTYAVLGCGANICYPPGNRRLYEKLTEHGGILSEYPPDTQPLPHHFPLRNRIISGLCDALIVVEAKEKSGSLITADAALEQGKDVYAVPGRMEDALSLGCNRLIKQGADILLSPEDFLHELGFEQKKNGISKNFSKNLLEKEEMLVYSVLDLQPRNINEIINATGLEAAVCIQLLVRLEEKGYIRETFQNYYMRSLNV